MHGYGVVVVGLLCAAVAIDAAQWHPSIEFEYSYHDMMTSGDCCRDVCSWTPPTNCACCGCSSALNACLCCDTPARHGNKGEKCESTTWHGFATYDCEVNLANEGYVFCQQECSGWCWATALATLTAFYGGGPKTSCASGECAQASARAGFDCCKGRAMNATCADDRCNHGVYWEDFVELLMKNVPGHTFVSLERSLPKSDLMRVLEDRHPVVLGLVKPDAGGGSELQIAAADNGHIIAVVGYRTYLLKGGGLDNQFLVSDSLRGALDWFTYDGLRAYSAFKWTKTVYGKNTALISG